MGTLLNWAACGGAMDLLVGDGGHLLLQPGIKRLGAPVTRTAGSESVSLHGRHRALHIAICLSPRRLTNPGHHTATSHETVKEGCPLGPAVTTPEHERRGNCHGDR